MKFDVITIGAGVRDVYVQSDDFTIEDRDTDGIPEACFVLGGKLEIDRPVFSSGGGATNAAATFAHLGLKTACVAKVGKDDAGRDVEADLKHHGVYTNLMVKANNEGTGYSTLLTTAEGRRTAIVYRGASATLQPKEISWDKINTKWIYITSLKGNLTLLKRIYKHAAANNIHVAWNPGSAELALGMTKLKPFFAKTDILSLNREEAAKLTRLAPSDLRAIISRICKMTGHQLVLTDGKHGTYASDGADTFYAYPNDVPVINTTGAGDAFGSGYAAGIIEHNDMVMALRLGTLNAEGVIQEIGAKNGILTRMPGTRRLASVKVEPYKI